MLKAQGHLEASRHMWLDVEVMQGTVKEDHGQVSGSPSTAMLACQIEAVG